jgi:hypothetical protein
VATADGRHEYRGAEVAQGVETVNADIDAIFA